MTPSSTTGAPAVTHFFTVDVEEYFHVNAFEGVIAREEWDRWPKRLEHSMPVLLDRLHRAGARGTFFVLGWVARQSADIVRAIAAAGHEVASHSFWHRRVVTMTPAEFRDDLRASKQILEDVVGAAVVGFRAPSFSIIPGYEWAFDVLLEEGFRYDSSVFPIKRSGYGNPNAPRVPYTIQRKSGSLAEFPLATTTLFGRAIPAAGGGYLRQFPFGVVRRAFAEATRDAVPATFYVHPWEIDPDQPRVPVSALTRVRHYRGLRQTLPRIERLLGEFQFGTIGSALAADPSLIAPSAAS
ncbi:MAG TPA: XrtA system polysaccharide deacetylase [Gemmatimonadaceae bacterium]|nr:XrtA system polysaccharide deacetylase [Gemmatimonadaceae bacterium]